MRATLLALGLTALTACTQISGTIDGEEVDYLHGAYVEDDNYFGDDGLILIYLAQFEEPCAVYTEFLDDFNDADSPQERAEAWQDNLPEEFWELQIWLRVDDVDAELGGAEFSGVDWDDAVEEDDEAAILGRRYKDHPSEGSFAWWGGFTGESTDWFETYRSDDGQVKVQGHDPGESIRGRYDTRMVDADGDQEGEVTVRFNAQRCRDAEDYIF
ncbi:MAG: hypothetical protein H6741_15860 [Alphaproteobacteria bacterium]|nr:hypothetical protein [Alphaproteobacteria bacterium]